MRDLVEEMLENMPVAIKEDPSLRMINQTVTVLHNSGGIDDQGDSTMG